MLPPKTVEEARSLIEVMRSYYRKQRIGFVEDDTFYEGNFETTDIMSLPKGFDITIPPTGRAVVDEGVDNVDPSDIRIFYAPRGKSQVAAEEAETIQRFLKGVWTWWRQTNSDVDVLRDFIKNLFKNGKAVLKLVPDYTLWPSLLDDDEISLDKGELMEKVELIEKVRKDNFPLVLRSLPPGKILEDPTMNGRKLWVIETYQTSNDEMTGRFIKYKPELADLHGQFAHEITEIWTATHIDPAGNVQRGRHFVFIGQEFVNGIKEGDTEVAPLSPYHDVPYIIKHSGFGRETMEAKPEEKATGFYTLQVKSMLKAEIRRFTHFDALMSQLAFPIALLPDELEDIDLDFSPGAINWVPSSVHEKMDKLFLTVDLPTGDYLQTLSLISNQIERGTTQRAIRGAGVPGTDSAAQLQMVTSQARLRIDPIKRTAEEAVDEVNSRILWYIDEIFKESVSIWAVGPDSPSDMYHVKPAMIKGRYRTKTNFMPNEEQQRERKMILAGEAMTKMAMNEYDAYMWAGFENATEIVQRNLAFKMLENPLIQDAMAREAMRDVLGLDPDTIEMIAMQGVAEKQRTMQGLMQGGAPSAPPPQATGAPVGSSTPPPGGPASQDIASLGGG